MIRPVPIRASWYTDGLPLRLVDIYWARDRLVAEVVAQLDANIMALLDERARPVIIPSGRGR